jgi:two-component system, sensor histidine kinase and response regulator
MGGTIDVSSELGKGSVFSVRIPMFVSEQPPAAATRGEAERNGSKAKTKFSGVSVLLAEDKEFNRVVAVKYLSGLGCEIHTVTDGVEAVAEAAKNDYDIIFMDLQMPNMDGLTATQAIREAERSTRGHTPIVAMTAHALTGDREKCLDAGMDDYLPKPIDEEKLIGILTRWCGEHDSDSGEHQSVRALVKRFLGDVTMVVELTPIFIEDFQLNFKALELALADKDVDKVATIAHGMRGSCYNFGATLVGNDFLEVETAAKVGDFPKAKQSAAKGKMKFKAFEKKLNLFMKAQGDKS